jgi:hypothetical protein
VDQFIRVSGFLFFLFGLLSILFRAIQFLILGDPPLAILALDHRFIYLQGIPSLFAAIFFLSGATALYLRQANRTGRLGLFVYFAAFTGLVISTGAMWTYAFTAPELARNAPQLLSSSTSAIIRAVMGSLVVGQLGWLMLLVVSLKGRVVPRWALVLAILSIILVVIATPYVQSQVHRLLYNVLLGIGPLVVGYVLWRSQEM